MLWLLRTSPWIILHNVIVHAEYDGTLFIQINNTVFQQENIINHNISMYIPVSMINLHYIEYFTTLIPENLRYLFQTSLFFL